jgi:hypothetical protein
MFIIYIGFYVGHTIENDDIYINLLKDTNHTIDKKSYTFDKISNNELDNYILESADIIICGNYSMYIKNINFIKLIYPYINKIIYTIKEPIEFNDQLMHNIYMNGLFKYSIGCVPENNRNIKFPLYFYYNLKTSDKILEISNYVKTITLEQLLTKKYCCLINRHDMGNTRVNIYKKLIKLGNIICPSTLLNNFSNEQFEEIGREIFQKEFIFSICPENFIVKLEGYVTEKLMIACCCGNLPIYYGKLDDIDKQIFNINRIILYDPVSEESLNNTYNFIKDLISDPIKLYNFYKQDIFMENAWDVMNKLKQNAKNRLEIFFNEIKENSINNNYLYLINNIINKN